MEKGIISNSQFTILVVMFTLGSSTLIAPPLVVVEANRDAWISVILTTLCGILLVLLYSALAKRYPKLTLLEKSNRILGSWLGRAAASLFVLYCLLLTSVLVRVVGDFLTTLIMPETPIQAIEVILCITVIYGVRLGLEPYARTSEILLPWVMFFFVIFVLVLIPEYSIKNFLPIMEDGIKPVLRGSIPLIGVPFLDLMIFLMITPYVSIPGKVGRNLLVGMALGSTVLLTIVLLSIMVLGADFTTRLNYPIYELAQRVQIGRFIQRIEVVVGGIIFISIFVKITICFYSLVLSLSQLLGLKSYRTVTFPMGMLVIALSLVLSPNIIFFRQLALDVWTPLSLLFGLLFPVLLIVVDSIRFSRRKKLQH